jgi:hypothetical protein
MITIIVISRIPLAERGSEKGVANGDLNTVYHSSFTNA